MWAAAGGATASISVSGAWGSSSSGGEGGSGGSGTTTNTTAAPIKVPAGNSVATLTLSAPASTIKLWWPNGYGRAQPLYNVTATVITTTLSGGDGGGSMKQTVSDTRAIGFRVNALVTGNDTVPGYVAAAAHQEGSDGQ